MIYDGLNADSSVYTHKSEMYELFSQAEDSLGKIAAFLQPRIANKTVLDFGCGTGKFIQTLSPVAKKYFAVDVSEAQLKIARSKATSLPNVEILKIEKDKLPFENESIDDIFCTFVVGGIQDLELRATVLKELQRVLKPGGKIYLVENDVGGEYKEITGGTKANERTVAKLAWFKEHGYRESVKIITQFEFKNLKEAQEVFEVVWDKSAAEKVKEKIVGLNLTVYEFAK
jgi:ubiquinone/menaquinone biosynthesis C-methylase UbiE